MLLSSSLGLTVIIDRLKMINVWTVVGKRKFGCNQLASKEIVIRCWMLGYRLSVKIFCWR